MKIFLIGMPGSGKSTLGKQLAEKMSLPFIDLDAEITKQKGQSISDIFQEQGEAVFRTQESAQLKKSSSTHHSFVMACGGGTPCFYDNLEMMKKQGTVFFLDVSVSTLLHRVKNSSTRPMLPLESEEDTFKRLEKLRQQRLSFYQSAHITLGENEISADAIIEIILKRKTSI
jgi:shikimate kinase